MWAKLTLVSHYLCPYVQRGVIALTEKQVPFDRIYVDLADKPDWFTRRASWLARVQVIAPVRSRPVVALHAAICIAKLRARRTYRCGENSRYGYIQPLQRRARFVLS